MRVGWKVNGLHGVPQGAVSELCSFTHICHIRRYLKYSNFSVLHAVTKTSMSKCFVLKRSF